MGGSPVPGVGRVLGVASEPPSSSLAQSKAARAASGARSRIVWDWPGWRRSARRAGIWSGGSCNSGSRVRIRKSTCTAVASARAWPPGVCGSNCPEDMLSPIRSECTESAEFSSLSAHANGLWPLLVLASRHHRVPVLRDDPKPLGLAPATTTGNRASSPDPKRLSASDICDPIHLNPAGHLTGVHSRSHSLVTSRQTGKAAHGGGLRPSGEFGQCARRQCSRL